MKLLVISYTVKVHCTFYWKSKSNKIANQIEKDIPQTLVIAEDDPRFIELKKSYGERPFHKNDINDIVLNSFSGLTSEWFDCFFEDESFNDEGIQTTPVGSPKLKSFKIINCGGRL